MNDEMRVDRRTVVAGAGAAVIGLVAAGCSTAAPTGSGVAPAPAPAPAAGTTLGPASDVPVGGGKIYADQKIVVTQPTAGTYVGLSATCTHQGCAVSKIENGTIDCPCHGSRFNLDGSVAKGPATKPLSSTTVSATNGQITLG
jgi:Rieske Fe-S protein